MAADLGTRANEDQLLRAYWLMAYDSNRRHWHGSRTIKERFNLRQYQNKHKLLLRALNDFLANLRSATVAYCDTFAPTRANAFRHIRDQSVRQQVRGTAIKLTRLGSLATILPLMIATHIHCRDGSQGWTRVVRGIGCTWPTNQRDSRLWYGEATRNLNIFTHHYFDYRFGGSTSLKNVLPVLVPSLSYSELEVQDGTMA